MFKYVWFMYTFLFSNAEEFWKPCESVCVPNSSYSTANFLVQNATCQVEKHCDRQDLYNSLKTRRCTGGNPSTKIIEVLSSEVSKAHLDTLQILESNNEYFLELLWNFTAPKAHNGGNSLSEWILKFGVFIPNENFSTCHSIKFYNESLQYLQDFISFCIRIPPPVVPFHFKIISGLHIIDETENFAFSLPTISEHFDIRIENTSSEISLKVWNADINYLINKNILNIQFAPEPSYNQKMYDVDVYETTENCDSALNKPLMHDRIEAKWPLTTKNATLKFERCHNYLIVVSHSHENNGVECSGDCFFPRSVASACLKIPSEFWSNEEAYCDNWNGTFYIHPWRGENITIEFKVDCCKHDTCCDNLKIMLARLRMKDCNKVFTVPQEKFFKMDKRGNSVTFHNVKEIGYYCAKVTTECKDEMKPHILNSYVVIREPGQTYYTSTQNHTEDVALATVAVIVVGFGEPNIIAIIAVAVVMLIIAVLAGIFWWKRKYYQGPEKTEMKPIYKNCCPLSIIQENAKKITVVLLYTHDSTTKKRVQALAKFLCDVINFNIVYDDKQLPLVAINEEGWITNLLNYGCKKMGDDPSSNTNKKIIIVESEQAVKHQKHQKDILKNIEIANRNIENPPRYNASRQIDELESFDKLLERLFIYGLSIITSNVKKRLEDYCHLFVVRFSDENSECRLEQLVPNKRYRIPDHLPELCLDLSEVSTDIIKKDELANVLEEKWKNEMPV